MRTEKRIRTALAAAWLAVAGLALLRAQAAFRFDGALTRVITPNGDGKNDEAIFCFGNPADSDVEGRIFTLSGSEVARLSRVRAALAGCPPAPLNGSQHMIWDGRSSGSVVRSGIYVYQIKSEGLTFTGTLLVVR